jgi:glutamate-1-semialdehyde 2,1-aminomutase
MSSYSTSPATPGIFVLRIDEEERALAHEVCSGFVPDRLFDLHAHLLIPEHFPSAAWPPYLNRSDSLGFAAFRQATADIFGHRRWDGLFFGFPARRNSVERINEWMGKEVQQYGDQSAALWLARQFESRHATLVRHRELDAR